MSAQDGHVDLVGLVQADLGNAEVARARAHLSGCASCREELVDVIAGHALVARTAGVLASAPAPRRAAPAVPTAQLPPLRRPSALHRARVPLAAAALVLVASLVAVLGLRGDDDPEPPVAAERSATLEPVEGDGTGRVSMRSAPGGPARMVIETDDLPALEDGQFYYAWLLDPETDKMLPLGQVWPGGSSTFAVDDALLASYSAVDVSLEQDDGDPQHSPVSVLRASYT